MSQNALKDTIQRAMASQDTIPRRLVREWIRTPGSVEIDALLYNLTRDAWHRIEPRLESDETCALIQRYLFGCIRENPPQDVALTRYEAAHELEAWFEHLIETNGAPELLRALVDDITTLFLSSNDEVRLAIETGFLEHVLEQRTLRHFFAAWASDERLQEAWRKALQWGNAHPNMMKRMRGTLRSPQSDDE